MRRLAFIAALALSCSSCAFMNRRNRPLLNLCERHMVPEDTAAKVVMAPVLVPMFVTAGLADTVLVHPVAIADDAWFQTRAAAWQPTGRGYVTECALFPLRAAATPPLWLFSATSRALFDIPRWPPSPAVLERELLSDDAETRLIVVRELHRRSYQADDIAPATRAMIAACRAHPNDLEFAEAAIARMPHPLTDEALAYLAELAATGRGRRCAAAVARLFFGLAHRPRTSAQGAPGADRALETLAKVYDGLVAAGHHEAEVYVAVLAGFNTRRARARALALYITRSLARRNWPDYAEAAAFLLQARLLRDSKAAQIEAVDYEWRALRVSAHWPQVVAQAIRRQQGGKDNGTRRAHLVRQQNVISARLRAPRPGQAKEFLQLTESLVDIKTMLDAEEVAERLIKGPRENLILFMGDPLELLKKKDGP